MKKFQTLAIFGFLFVLLAFVVGRDRDFGTAQRAEAQTAPTGADVEALRESIGNFFENITDPNKEARVTLEDLFKNSPTGLHDEKAITALATDIKTMNTNFGAYLAYEPAGVKTIGSDLTMFRYLVKYQDYAVVWYFTYYRPRAKTTDPTSGTWALIGLRFDSNLEAALHDAAF